MKRTTFFITGTDTGVGKTVLTALLAEFLHQRGVRVAALKPICSGGRDDALAIRKALGGAMTLDEINPWHFQAAVAPLLAARRERKTVTFKSVAAYCQSVLKEYDVTLIEGAGGLLSPMGEGFDSRDLIRALDAVPIIVAPNKLGVVNSLLLTLEALPERNRKRSLIVLVAPQRTDSATATTVQLLRAVGVKQEILGLPRFGVTKRAAKLTTVVKALIAWVQTCCKMPIEL